MDRFCVWSKVLDNTSLRILRSLTVLFAALLTTTYIDMDLLSDTTQLPACNA